jgi:hypothetical protein
MFEHIGAMAPLRSSMSFTSAGPFDLTSKVCHLFFPIRKREVDDSGGDKAPVGHGEPHR